MKSTFSNDIQAIHRTTRFLLKTVLVIFCMAMLFAASQGVTDAIGRITQEQTTGTAIRYTIEHAEVGDSAVPSDTTGAGGNSSP